MSNEELKELSKLLNEFRDSIDKDMYYRATDFEILKSFVQCAIIQSKDITPKG